MLNDHHHHQQLSSKSFGNNMKETIENIVLSVNFRLIVTTAATFRWRFRIYLFTYVCVCAGHVYATTPGVAVA